MKAIEPFRSLVLGGQREDVEWSWELAVVPMGIDRTRLISRNRAWIPSRVGSRLMMLFIEPAAFLMTRKMLLGIKRRAEGMAHADRKAACPLDFTVTTATARENLRALPGDEMIRHAAGILTHATTCYATAGSCGPGSCRWAPIAPDGHSSALFKERRGGPIRWRKREIAPGGTIKKRLYDEALGNISRSVCAEVDRSDS